MATGFCLINTRAGKESNVYHKVQDVPEVVELHPVFGEYDIIAKIEAEDFNHMGRIVVDKIRSIDNVIDTKTLYLIRH